MPIKQNAPQNFKFHAFEPLAGRELIRLASVETVTA